MDALPGRGVGPQQLLIGHGDLVVGERLAHLVERAVLANAAAQFTVVASSDVIERTPQGTTALR